MFTFKITAQVCATAAMIISAVEGFVPSYPSQCLLWLACCAFTFALLDKRCRFCGKL